MPASYISPRFQAVDDVGRPIVGGRLYTYVSKSTIPKPTYQDVDGTAANTNPVILDANGAAVLYLISNEAYTFVLRDENGVLLWSQDDIIGQLNFDDIDAATEKAVEEATSVALGYANDAAASAASAEADADRAETAADAAAISSLIYPDTSTAITGDPPNWPAVPAGMYFEILSPDSDGFVDLYQNVAGTAVYIDTYPNRNAINTKVAAEASERKEADRELDRRKLDRVITAAPGSLFTVTDRDNNPTVLDISDEDGNFTPTARTRLMNQIGLKFRIDLKDYLMWATDLEDNGTQLAIDIRNGKFPDWVLNEWGARMGWGSGGGGGSNATDFYIHPATDRLERVLPVTTFASGWGSSSMQYCRDMFATMFDEWGVDYFDGGVSGQRSDAIAACAGSIPALVTVAGGEIPASGAIGATISNIAYPGGVTRFEVAGTLAGVPGVLEIDRPNSAYLFTRDSSGDAVTVAADTPFIPAVANQVQTGIGVLWMGKNDISNVSPSITIANTDATFDAVRTLNKRVLVLGHFANGNWGASSSNMLAMREINGAHAERYGELYVDVQGYLSSPQVWIDTGITPTSQDLDDQVIGRAPVSLRRDNGHLTDEGYQAVVNLCKARMLEFGWYQ